MQESSRAENTKRNIMAGLINKGLNIVLIFLTRTMVLYLLGATYQGLSSLFTSVLNVLNLTDFGFSIVVTYILYKPVAEHDDVAICAIIAFLRKIYRIVGIAILGLGIILLPFLNMFISGDAPSDINVYILYIMYLGNATISYFFFAYKGALLNAMQRNDLVSKISSVTSLVLRGLQIILLLKTQNYYLFVAAIIACSLFNNLLLQMVSNYYFPKLQPKGKISEETQQVFFKQIKGIMFNKIGDTARNSLDNIIISSLLGLTIVAVYGNYYYVYAALYEISLVIVNAMQASVGNSIAKESIEKNYKDLMKFTFIFTWFTGWCTVCLCCLYQHFMDVWLNHNADMMLSNFNMILFCIYFYTITINNIRNLYINGAGIFWKLRIWYVLEAVANLLLNIVLGRFMGVTGIILATIITIFVFNFVARTNVLFREYFHCAPSRFYILHFYYATVTALASVVTYFICAHIKTIGILGLVIKILICCIIPNFIFFLFYVKTEQFCVAFKFIKRSLYRRV